MNIAKLIAGAALAAAPLSIATAQSGTPSDSGSNGHRGEWIAGAGALAGAGLFMAFAHSSHDGSSVAGSGFAFKDSGTNPALTPDPVPNGSSTSPSDTSTVGAPSDTGTATPPDTGTTTPPDTNIVNPGPQNDPPAGSPFIPPNDDSPTLAAETSTVPEPGSLVLLATGIIGLAPLVKRRRK